MKDLRILKLLFKHIKDGYSKNLDLREFAELIDDTIGLSLGIDVEDLEDVSKYYFLVKNNYEQLVNNDVNPNNYLPYEPKNYTIDYREGYRDYGNIYYKEKLMAPDKETAKELLQSLYDTGKWYPYEGIETDRESSDWESLDFDIDDIYLEGSRLSLRKKLVKESEEAKAFLPQEVFIFRRIQKELKELKTKDNIIGRIKEILEYMGFDPLEAMFYYYLFTANFREDGRYDLTKESEKKPLQSLKPVKTTNTNAQFFAKSKIPFKGSNFEGFWEKDLNGVDQYIITSYQWYPIFIFKQGKWYKNANHYSSSTGRHISDTGIGYQTPKFSPGEMNAIRAGKNPDKVREEKYENFVKTHKNDIGKTLWRKVQFDGYNAPPIPDALRFGKVKFKITDINLVNGKPVVDVEITEGGFTNDTGKLMTRTYQHPSYFSEKMESIIGRALRNDLYYGELENLDDLTVDVKHPSTTTEQETQIPS